MKKPKKYGGKKKEKSCEKTEKIRRKKKGEILWKDREDIEGREKREILCGEVRNRKKENIM